MDNLCVSCNERPVKILKRKLCIKCYQLMRSKGEIRKTNQDDCIPTVKKYRHKSEMEFVRNYFDHSDWVYQPGMFRLGKLRAYHYQPDFYDARRNVFIEVAGTRQAYHANKEKYILMRQLFPLIRFEVRHVDGSIIDEDNRVHWSVSLISQPTMQEAV